MNHRVSLILVLTGSALAGSLHAGWGDLLDRVLKSPSDTATEAVTDSRFGQEELAQALRQALDRGAALAVTRLGREDGFLANPEVRIPVPESLNWAEKGLRSLGQGSLVDDFQLSLNRAAEKAVPDVLDILRSAISGLTLSDAEEILKGPDDAATRYFRRTSEAELEQRILPIVSEATREASVTRYYKAVIEKAGFMGQLVPGDATDLDGYVTGRALDGLFLTLAEEERHIREDPLARSTDLMRKVFSAYQR